MSDGDAGERPHLFRQGSGPVLLMLHGTGGSEQQIAQLAPLLDPAAAVLAPRGRLLEQGMTRWFARLREGVFDADSVVEEASSLVAFLAWAQDRYDLAGRSLVAVGLSNGANIALATLLLHPQRLTTVVALSGMHPLPERDGFDDLAGTRTLLLNGDDDPMAPSASVDRLEHDLRSGGTQVDRRVRPGGHGLVQAEIDAAADWIRRLQ